MILIGTPSSGDLKAPMVSSLTRLMRHSPETEFLTHLTTYIGQARTELAYEALRLGASHLLYLDSDMVFPPTLLEAFLSHDVDVVGANYRRRRPDYEFTAMSLSHDLVDSTGRTGLEPVRTMGFGAVLVRASVFRRLDPPWFSNPEVYTEYEDTAFCFRCLERGIVVQVDHDVSQHVFHLGTVPIGVSYRA